MKQLNPFPTDPCVVCKKSVSNQIILICCKYPCHVACADNWRKNPHLITHCAYIPQGHSATVIEILNYDWKEDPQFVKEVNRIWNGYLWYGICHTGTEPLKDSGEKSSSFRIQAATYPIFLATPKAKSFHT